MLLGRTGDVGYDRLLTLSDGVFAIAMTLLVLNFHTPTTTHTDSQLASALFAQGGTLLSYALSVVIIGRYWIAHHQMFEFIRGFDFTLAFLNIAFIGTVAFLPFPTSVLGEHGGTTAVVFYSASICAVGITQLAEWVYAWRFHHPNVEAIPDDAGRLFTISIGRIIVVFALSIPVAFANPTAAQFMWLLGLAPTLFLRNRRRAVVLRHADTESGE